MTDADEPTPEPSSEIPPSPIDLEATTVDTTADAGESISGATKRRETSGDAQAENVPSEAGAETAIAEADAAATAGGSAFPSVPVQPGPATWGIAVLAALFLISAGVFVGTLLDGPRSSEQSAPAVATPSEIDVGFLRDMQTHHAQAVQMAVLIRDRTDDEEIRNVALDIQLTQQQQIGQMYGLLASWGKPQSNPDPMDWMTSDTSSSESGDSADTGDPHAGMSDMPGAADMSEEAASPMPGMASDADLERLASLRGKAAERLFLELMIAHHQGGIPMATAAAEGADESWVRTLAQSIVDAQSAEITALRAMLDDRDGSIG